MITSGRSRVTAASPVAPSAAVLTSYFACAEVDLQRAQDGRLVDDEDPGHDPAPSGDVPTLATGSVTWTVSPPPGVSAAAMRPPMASAKPLATARPSPTPG